MTLSLFDLILCPYFGLMGCGKTTWTVKLLKRHEELCTHTSKKLISMYGVEQPGPFKTTEDVNVNLSRFS